MIPEPEFMQWKREAARVWYECVKDMTPEEYAAFLEEENQMARQYMEALEERMLPRAS